MANIIADMYTVIIDDITANITANTTAEKIANIIADMGLKMKMLIA